MNNHVSIDDEDEPEHREGHPELLEDRCKVCGTLLGIGIPQLHLGLCEACAAKAGKA